MHKTPDIIEQHRLLTWVAGEIDAGCIRATGTETISPVNAVYIRKAHQMVETERTIGKIMLEGWGLIRNRLRF
ncbi:hypothetical protein [Ahrensia sp. R2A130]|uniref:hypothetical protein n=1 Tax=Ahrensia sp. R2A130 TaxID=744979 RepID=UPI001FFF0EC3